MLLERILQPHILALLIPLAGIIVAGIAAVLGEVHRHRERLAMIEQGMDPDGLKGQRGLAAHQGAAERIG